MKQTGLGRGLSALLKEEVASVAGDELIKILDINRIEAGDYQPRKHFEYEKIRELADSISNSGLLQPIIVSKNRGGGKYKVIAGERRLRACKIAGLNDVPVIVKDLSNKEILEIALVENIQREGLSAVEEAEGFARLIEEFAYTQDQIAKTLGKSRSHVANLLRLNQLPQAIKDKINEGFLTMGHARCLIGHEHAEVIALHIIENDLSVRQTENIVKNWSKREYSKTPVSDSPVRKFLASNDSEDNDLRLLAKALSEKFGIKITIENYTVGGKLTFHYSDLEQLDTILTRLN